MVVTAFNAPPNAYADPACSNSTPPLTVGVEPLLMEVKPTELLVHEDSKSMARVSVSEILSFNLSLVEGCDTYE